MLANLQYKFPFCKNNCNKILIKINFIQSISINALYFQAHSTSFPDNTAENGTEIFLCWK